MLTATQLRTQTDAANSAVTRGPLEQAYAQMANAANIGLGQTMLDFFPFFVLSGGSADSSLTPFLGELNANGFVLTNTVDGAGTTFLVVSW